MTGIVAGKYSALLGGVPRSGAPTHTFETLMRELGFGMFPWSAVAVFALARPLIRLDGDGPPTNARLAFGQLYLFLFAGLGFALSTYRLIIFGEARAAEPRAHRARRSASSSTRRSRAAARSPSRACSWARAR